MPPPPLLIQRLVTTEQLTAVFPLVAQLRDRITPQTFVAEVRRQEADGYIAVAGFIDGRAVVFAGYRLAHTLSRGPHLFVDDLVTDAAARGRGHGREMLRWLAQRAVEAGVPRVYLDSRDTARGFYEQVGFAFLTSIPCAIDAAQLMRELGGDNAEQGGAR